MKGLFVKNHLWMTTAIAGILCFAMFICDVCVSMKAPEEFRESTLVVENHLMDEYFADGVYDGRDSDSETGNSGVVTLTNGRKMFNILEILPTEKKGIIGYMIGGCEPFDVSEIKDGSGNVIASVEEMRAACMDAMINKAPGSNNSDSKNGYNNGDIDQISKKLAEINGHEAFTVEGNEWKQLPNGTWGSAGGRYDGYYKYVGSGNGVYAKATSTNGSDDSVVMVSKFYKNDRSNDGHFDYIFVYGATSNPDDIKVTNHRRLKYTNLDKFFRDCYPVSDVATWKSEHKITVMTRTPATVTDKDIEDADLIFINNANNMDYFKYALRVQNRLLGNSNLEEDNGASFSSSLDLTFPQVFKIYDRIVAKEDVALIASRNCVSGHTFDTNLRKLMCMLFYVKQGSGVPGSGRRLFMDYFKSYVASGVAPSVAATGTSNSYNGMTEANGYMYQDFPWETDPSEAITDAYYDADGNVVSVYGGADAAVKHEIYGVKLYRSKSNTTDYFYIDEETGALKVDKKYSGKWYNVDWVGVDASHPNGFEYKQIYWNNLEDEYMTWPWDHSGESDSLKIWQFPSQTEDNGRGHLPIFYQYVGWGDYHAINDTVNGSYRNQSLEQENEAFKGDLVKQAIAGRAVKREESDEAHREEGGELAYYISANILNGDGVGEASTGGTSKNKVLYYNVYEKDTIKSYESTNSKANIPVILQIKSSCPVTKIELLKLRTRGATPETSTYDTLATYSPSSSNNISGMGELTFSGGSTGGVKFKYSGPTDTASLDKIAGTSVYIYQYDTNPESDSGYDGAIYDLLCGNYINKLNSTFAVKITAEPIAGEEKSVIDEITVVGRDFFYLN